MTRKASRRKKKITKYITSVGPDIDLYAPPQCLMEGNATCHKVSRTVKVAQYFQAIRSFPDRAIFRAEWIERVVASPERESVQADDRVRRWARIDELQSRYLRVVLLPDRVTAHNAFFDGGYRP
jgi:hypothetical protein